ncbi:SAP domain-containing protein [Actinidia rufa]|uniref:SAP domain-containing protein n=1 Tax=Actinidia rufa TaxID=165716 RepID=A0A7J0F647_9ERIC|nr:SAP domain-containing protein [Actinidia rufa]
MKMNLLALITDSGSDDIPQPVLQTEESGTVPAVNESTGDMTDHGNEKNEVDGVNNQSQVDDIPELVFQTEDGGTVPAVHETTRDMTDHGVEKNEVDGIKDQAQVVDIPQPVFQTEDGGTNPAVHETTGNLTDHGNEKNEVDGVKDQAQVDDTVSLGEGKVQEEEVTVGTDSSRDEENQEMVVSATSVETSITVNESVISEIAVNVQESHISDSQNGKGDLESQLENEEVNPPREDNELNSSDPNTQGDDKKAVNAEMSKKIDNADVDSSEKLNLDRSSGDDSMEEDALESKQIISKNNPDEVVEKNEKPEEVSVVEEKVPVDDMQIDIPADKKYIQDENNNAPAAPTVKRKLHDQVVGNNETSKRQRRWNSENLKVPELQSNIASSTTPKDMLPSTTLKRNFSRSNSAASEDAPKECVVPPSPKPPTNSLKIDRFLRPFTLKAVQELLGKTGTVASFWMDHIKTHCYVTYSSVEEAVETRNAVYNLQWPPNGGRLLVAEFVDPQEVKMRAEASPQSPATPVGPGPTIPPTTALQPPQPSPRQLVQRQQLPPPLPLPPPPPLSNPPQARERLSLPPPPPLPEKVDPPIVTLDDLFKKTEATPRIYYLPLSDEQVAAKLKAQGKSTKQSAGVACRNCSREDGTGGTVWLMDLGFFRSLLWVEVRFKLGLEPRNLRFLPMPGQAGLWFLLVLLSSRRSNFIELELLVSNFLVDVIFVFDQIIHQRSRLVL